MSGLFFDDMFDLDHDGELGVMEQAFRDSLVTQMMDDVEKEEKTWAGEEDSRDYDQEMQ